MSSTVMASFLCTDLVQSTAIAERLGPDAAGELRRAYYGLLREAIGSSGGSEVRNTGDGLVAVFPSAEAAVSGAVAVQQTLERHNRRASERLAVRAGVSAGDAWVEHGDYVGPPLVEAAALCAACAGDQILVSELVRDLVGSRGRHSFGSRAEIPLPGSTAPVRACEVHWSRRDPGGEPDTALPSRLAVSGFGCFGRAGELAQLEEALKRADEGERQVVLISGEGGIGKTHLAAEAGRLAQRRGATVRYGRCDEDVALAYQPFIEVLRDLVARAPDALITAHVEEHGGDLARLVPELARRVSDLPPPVVTDPEAERYLLFAAVVGMIARAAADTPAVIVLDDLHWADRPSLSLLRHVISADPDMRVLVLVTYRDTELSRQHPLTDLLAGLHRERNVVRIALRGLDDVALIALVEDQAGHPLGEPGISLAHALHRETDGNPFFVSEILRHLAESGTIWQRPDGRWAIRGELEELGLPQSVHDVIGRRVSHLGESALEILSMAAVIGRDFDLDVLASVVEVSEDDALDVLDAAATAAIVEDVADTPGRFSFAHALIPHTLYADLSPTRRQRAHRRVAEALERLGLHHDADERVGELAHHWALATLPADAAKAVEYARLAGDRALARLAPQEAIDWYTQAIDFTTGQPAADRAERCDLLLSLGEAQRESGDMSHRETLLAAANLAQELGDSARLASAALVNNAALFSATGERDEARLAVLEAALEAVDTRDSAIRARLLATLAAVLVLGDDERRVALSDEAIAMARRVGERSTLAHVLALRYEAIRHASELPELGELAEELEELASHLEDPYLAFWAAIAGFEAALAFGDVPFADQRLAAADRLAAKLGQEYLRWVVKARKAARCVMDADFAEAERLGIEAATSGQPDASTFFAALVFLIRYLQGRLDEIEALVAATVEQTPGLPSVRAGLALLYCELDRYAEARSTFARVAADGFADFPRDQTWLFGIATSAEVCAHLGDADSARVLGRLLAPYREQFVTAGGAFIGSVRYYLGRVAATLGDYDEAERELAGAAAEPMVRTHAPAFLALTRLCWADVLVDRREPVDIESAREHLHAALATARSLGLATIARRAEALLASIGAAE